MYLSIYIYICIYTYNPVLDGVSFTVAAGSVCALVGRSGGGKCV